MVSKQLALYRRSHEAGSPRKLRPVAGLAIKSVERSRWRFATDAVDYGYWIGIFRLLGVISVEMV